MVGSPGARAAVGLLVGSLLCGVSVADTPEPLQTRLQKTVNLPKGIEANTRFQDALDSVAERWKLDIQVDVKLFRKRGVQDVQNQPIMLPRLVNVRLATVLELVARQVDGSCMTTKDRLVIVPRSAAGGAKAGGYRPFPVVATKTTDAGLRAKLDTQVSFDKGNTARLPLAEALLLLAGHCEVNIVIDDIAFKAARTKDVSNQSVQLAKIDNARLGDVLDKLCLQAKSGYRVQDNIIWIVPGKS